MGVDKEDIYLFALWAKQNIKIQSIQNKSQEE